MKMCLITGIFPPDIGGPATYVSRLAASLHQHGHDVCVVTLGDDTQTFPYPVRRISRILPLPIRLLLLFFILLRTGWNAGVWYINGLELPAVLAGKLLRKRLVLKVVSDYAWERAGNHGLTTDAVAEFQTKKQHWKVELHKALRAWIARQVAAVITPSQHVYRLVCGWGVPAERLRLIYNAVDDLPADLGSKAEMRRKLGLPADSRIVITVGRLIPLKQIDQIIRVVAELQSEFKTHGGLHLLVIGDGSEREKLTALAQHLHVAAQIRFSGQIEPRPVLDYLRAADLFVLNSTIEGLSHVILEAMLVGTPVLATAVGGNPELVRSEENGLLIPCGDLDALRAQVRRIINDLDLQAHFRHAGYETVQRFSWERLYQDTMTILM